MPTLKSLYEKYKNSGLEIVGIHMSGNAEKMADYLNAEKIAWPTAVDVDYKTTQSWAVEGFPTLYLIDRQGRLRFANVYDDDLEKAVAMLLEEKAVVDEEATVKNPLRLTVNNAESPLQFFLKGSKEITEGWTRRKLNEPIEKKLKNSGRRIVPLLHPPTKREVQNPLKGPSPPA